MLGVILAGGQSRRMFAGQAEGGDKGLLDIGGQAMLSRVIARLAPQTVGLVINANGDPSRFSAYGLPVCADTVGGQAGPLAGVLAGMRWAQEHLPEVAYIVTASADAPFLPLDLVERLSAALDRSQIAIAESGGEQHPVIGAWPVALADDLEAALSGGMRKAFAWTGRHGAASVAFPAAWIGARPVDPFFNVNTPADLEEARALLAHSGSHA